MIDVRGRARAPAPASNETDAPLVGLTEEMATYRGRLPELSRDREGQYVLIKGAEVVGVFSDRSEALRAGYERFGVVPFLVRRIAAAEPVVYLPNVTP